MGIKLQNKAQLLKEIEAIRTRYEKALIYELESAVVELTKHAKQSAEYTDRTANLKSSIGGVLLRGGKPVTYKGFQQQAATADIGVQTGMEYINSLIQNFQLPGYTIILVAGMEYASYVQDKHGYNVLKKTELKARMDLPKAVQRLKTLMK